MVISDVTIFRDGGTITILIIDDPKAGEYTLPTPFEPEPRSIHWKQYLCGERTPDGQQVIGIGSPEEAELLSKLQNWWKEIMTGDDRVKLKYLDSLAEWRNLPDDYDKIIRFHHVKTVIEYLKKRHPDKGH